MEVCLFLYHFLGLLGEMGANTPLLGYAFVQACLGCDRESPLSHFICSCMSGMGLLGDVNPFEAVPFHGSHRTRKAVESMLT